MATWTVYARYDFDDGAWCVHDADIPGLVVDAATLDELRSRITAVFPDLLEIHADDIEPARLTPPHRLHLIASHESVTELAA